MAELTDSLRSRVEADFALMTGGGTEAAHDAVVRSFGSDALNLYKSVDLAPGAPRIGLAAWIDFAERFAGLNGTTGLESLMTRVERSCSGAFVSKREPMDASWPVLEVDEENKQHSLVHLIAAVARKLAGLKAKALAGVEGRMRAANGWIAEAQARLADRLKKDPASLLLPLVAVAGVALFPTPAPAVRAVARAASGPPVDWAGMSQIGAMAGAALKLGSKVTKAMASNGPSAPVRSKAVHLLIDWQNSAGVARRLAWKLPIVRL